MMLSMLKTRGWKTLEQETLSHDFVGKFYSSDFVEGPEVFVFKTSVGCGADQSRIMLTRETSFLRPHTSSGQQLLFSFTSDAS